MSFIFCPLASGSKGNCLYLKTEKTTVLIDLGISFRQLEKRLFSIGAKIEDIDAILISHEHRDHIAGLKVFLEKKKVFVLANADTAKAIYRSFQILFNFRIFTTNEEFFFQDVVVDPFSVQHDTFDPVGFVIKTKKYKIGICSDLGVVTPLVRRKLQKCDLLYIEANHEVEYVHSSSRPLIYKERVLGRQGHLSNKECACLIKELYHDNLRYVYLAHLSSECNSPQKALKTIGEVLEKEEKNVKLDIAYQDKASFVFRL